MHHRPLIYTVGFLFGGSVGWMWGRTGGILGFLVGVVLYIIGMGLATED